jgi:glycosyltransferase involved in cell wall biosynthesis
MKKILILLAYYNRPKIVQNALYSILLANKYYKNWELAFLDDGSPIEGRPIVEFVLGDHLEKVKFYILNISIEEKISQGSRLGELANLAIQESDAEICFLLCDDDALHPFFLSNLNIYFHCNLNINHCFSKLIAFDPSKETFLDHLGDVASAGWHYNDPNKGPGCWGGILDGSQIAWRAKCNKVSGCWFKSPGSHSQDAYFQKELCGKCGFTYPTGFVGQFKGWFPNNITMIRSRLGKFSHREEYNWVVQNNHILDVCELEEPFVERWNRQDWSKLKNFFTKLY